MYLTEREKQVVKMIAEGLPCKQVAVCCGISDQTVKNHIYQARKRVGAFNSPHLVAIALREGLIN